MDIGAHCSVPACHQQDFLPFTCDCCNGVFCLEHRSYDAHECPKAGSHDRRVVQCPVCRQLIRWTAEQDVNAVWEQHVRVGQCTREKLQQQTQTQNQSQTQTQKPRKPKKKRCAADGCRDVLLTSNQFHCAKCGQDVCLKHRFEADHACESARQAQRQQWLGGFGSKPRSSSAAKPTASQLQRNAQQAAASVVSGTKSAVSSLVQNAKAASSAMAVTASSEQCPLCQQKFAYVSQLIAHVNRAHPDSSDSRRASVATSQPAVASAGVPAGSEVCPQCRAVFPSLTALIQHAETAHTGAVATGQAGGDQEKCHIM
ncbi:zinc finger an1 and c2h2 domain-containing stress-associated protein 16-like [Phytophthora cinnamomi]|uniref:zinc finger an1 and c2h2 domain-containing stress-associated protein 16-like n=1 Tax=Phytophthora cinnamomi TaxID=4785 RepID=UPI00355945DE|nr:zinc finger an1 and c2h2 domain-containing stress-associated protein 16-like [Phytophthora cinnamomi]